MLGSILGAVGGIASSILGNSQANKQAKLQKEFAQNAIQWKVADANAAGIHPLYALGANTTSYAPVSVGMPDLGAMGQDIGGAIDRVSTGQERVGKSVIGKMQLARAGLDNELVKANIAKTNAETAAIMSPSAPHVLEAPGMKAGPFITGDAKTPLPAVTSAQSWQDFGGEVAEQLFGTDNMIELARRNPGLLKSGKPLWSGWNFYDQRGGGGGW